MTRSNLVEVYISPPRAACAAGLGNIATRNYYYFVAVGHKFSSLAQKEAQKKVELYKSEYLWPVGRKDTNAALSTATTLLNSVGVDTARLNRDCKVSVDAYCPEGSKGRHFVPLYWVIWRSGDTSIEFLQPTRDILQLRIDDPKYNLRNPVEVQNVEPLLAQTNAAAASK